MLRDLADRLFAMEQGYLHRADLLYSRSLNLSPVAPGRNTSSIAQHLFRQLALRGGITLSAAGRFGKHVFGAGQEPLIKVKFAPE